MFVVLTLFNAITFRWYDCMHLMVLNIGHNLIRIITLVCQYGLCVEALDQCNTLSAVVDFTASQSPSYWITQGVNSNMNFAG